jgi:pyruvate dehydrogenase E2 component (dihydrolipoamide acetyltransferase)
MTVALVALEIPKVGLVMENARLVRWLKGVGDVVRQGEPVLELETEKSVVEIESTTSGRLVEILLQADQEARVGDKVAWLENDMPDVAVEHSHANRQRGERIKSSPVARRVATENAIDLHRIEGTGPNGRVQLLDVQRVIDVRRAAEPRSVASSPSNVPPTSSMRRALARAMTLSNATVPQFAVGRAVDWTALNARRAQLIAELPPLEPRPSLNDFLLQAIARTLLGYPALNATFAGDANSMSAAIVPAHGTHIGLVVAVDQGLLVPVFHRVEELTLAELSRRRRETVERALQGKLKREELEGATFSLSNLGKDGPDRFNALINPPQSAILAVGRQRDCVVPRNGSVEVRSMSELSLTVDHRVADGRLASDFLASLVGILEGKDL